MKIDDTDNKNPEKTPFRPSISFSVTVATWAKDLAEKKGYDNFSAYISDLIRKDKERDETMEAHRQKIRLELLQLVKAEINEAGRALNPSEIAAIEERILGSHNRARLHHEEGEKNKKKKDN